MRRRRYETMYILHPELSTDKKEDLVTKFQSIITGNGGEITQVQVLGKRRLAYEIANVREGDYVLMNYLAGTFLIGELNRVLKLTEGVIRHLTVRIE